MIMDKERDQIELLELKRKFGTEFKWCTAGHGEFYDNDCGKDCKEYEPRNKKSGRCRFSDSCLVKTGEKFLLTKDGLKRVDK